MIGTRKGALFELNWKNEGIKKIKEFRPSLQKENAIWTITFQKGFALSCFADGFVVKVMGAKL